MLNHQKSLASVITKVTAVPTKVLDNEKDILNRIEKHVNILDPINILKRGFSITLLNGKAVKSHDDVKPGDKITTIVANGEIQSEVRTSGKPENEK